MLSSTFLAGCYTYRPVFDATPPAGTRVALHLNDQGRAAVAGRIGPEIGRIEGDLVAHSDTAYVLSVSEVWGIYGSRSVWAGEQVSLRREYVGGVRERRFDVVRTVLAAGALVVVAAAIISGGSLLGIGSDDPGRPNGGGGEEQ